MPIPRFLWPWLSLFLALLGATPVPAQAVWMAGAPGTGLHLVPATSEGTVITRTVDGRQASLVDASAQPGYAYFDVVDPAYRRGGHPSLWVRIDVHPGPDEGLVLEYDSSAPGHLPGDFQPLALGPAGDRWTTLEFLVTDAEFARGTNGHDFRIAWPRGATTAVGRVELVPVTLPAAVTPRPRLVPPSQPGGETVVASLEGADLGLLSGSPFDAMPALQYGLDQVARAGGGVLFLDAGIYRLEHPLRIPAGVTLQGRPDPPGGGPVQGATILAVVQGRQQEGGPAAVSVLDSGTLRDLTFWYPDQNPLAIVPYPYTIAQGGGDGMTLDRVRLVNSYRGVQVGPAGNELHVLRDVSGSPLETGLEIGMVTDIGRIEGLDFRPDYWSSSGLPGSPPAGGAHADFMLTRGTGVRLFRSDWQYGSWSQVSGYRIGLHLALDPQGNAGDGQFFGWIVTGCATALQVDGCSNPGWAFTQCWFQGSTAAAAVTGSFTKALLFESTSFQGPVTLAGDARSSTSFLRCEFTGAVALAGGAAALTAPGWGPRASVAAEASVTAVTWYGDLPAAATFPPGHPLVPQPRPLPASLGTGPSLPSRPFLTFPPVRSLTVVTPGSGDDSPAIQRALNQAHPGGLVYLPGQTYSLKSPLTIPPEVELRGSFAGPHHTRAPGTRLEVRFGRNQGNGPPALSLARGSTLRGLTLAYPDQTPATGLVPYPATVAGRGAEVRVIDVTGVNPWDFLDLTKDTAHRHYVDGLAGSPLHSGIRLGGGNQGGVVANTQFNPHYWVRDPVSGPTLGSFDLVDFVRNHLEAFTLGWAKDHRFLQNFAYGSQVGLGLEGTGTRTYDGALWGLGVDGDLTSVEVRGNPGGEVTLVNGQFVSLAPWTSPATTDSAPYLRGSPQGNLELRFVAAQFWGTPTSGGEWKSGTLAFEGTVLAPGAPWEVRGGQLLGTNVLWASSRFPSDLGLGGGSAQFAGSISERGLRWLPPEPQPGLGDGVLALVPPVAPGATSLSVVLGRTPVPQGIRLVTRNGETDLKPVKIGDSWAWQSERALTPAANLWYVYADVSADPWRGPDLGPLTLEVTYWDQPGLNLRLVYDGVQAPWTEAGRITTTGSRTWKTWKVKLPTPWFQSRLNGSDLRLEVVGKTPLPMARWTLTRSKG